MTCCKAATQAGVGRGRVRGLFHALEPFTELFTVVPVREAGEGKSLESNVGGDDDVTDED